MSNDLNEKYFQTKRKHNESYNKRGYIIWIILGLGAISFFVAREFIEGRKLKERKDETIKEIVEQGNVSTADTLFRSKFTGTEILVLKNCIYKEFDDSFASIKNDSSGLTYLTKRIISDADYSSTIAQWKNSITATNPSYKFTNLKTDSVDNTEIETADIMLRSSANVDMKGTIKMTKKGGLIYMFQIVSYVDTWDKLATDIKRIEQSFKITE
jgi:hypothetical protein